MSADGSLAGSAPGRSKRQPRVVVRTLRSLALFGRKRALPRSAPSARNPHPLRSPSPAAMLDEPLRDEEEDGQESLPPPSGLSVARTVAGVPSAARGGPSARFWVAPITPLELGNRGDAR